MRKADREVESSLVTLVVNDLWRQITFYTEYVGLQVQWHDEYGAWLGVTQKDLLRLEKSERPQTSGKGTLALKLSSRCELSRVVARLCTVNFPNEVVDHGFRQSVYFDDSEGNKIALYVEREKVTMQGEIKPIDLELLFNELRPDDRLCEGLGADTEIGTFFSRD